MIKSFLQRVKWSEVGFHLLALAICALFLLPAWWMFSASLRPAGQPPPLSVEWLPSGATLASYPRLFATLPFGRYLLNSALVSVLGAALTVWSASWAGFGMARLPRRERRQLTRLTVALLMTPAAALWLTRFLLFGQLGLIDSYLALLLPAAIGSSPVFVLVYYWAFRRLPAGMFEAARMDGASALRAWWSVGMPLVQQASAAVATLAFFLYWGDFINPLLYLKSPELYTAAMGLQQLLQLDRTNWPVMMAGAVMLTVPVLAVFAVAQRWLLREGLVGDGL